MWINNYRIRNNYEFQYKVQHHTEIPCNICLTIMHYCLTFKKYVCKIKEVLNLKNSFLLYTWYDWIIHIDKHTHTLMCMHPEIYLRGEVCVKKEWQKEIFILILFVLWIIIKLNMLLFVKACEYKACNTYRCTHIYTNSKESQKEFILNFFILGQSYWMEYS